MGSRVIGEEIASGKFQWLCDGRLVGGWRIRVWSLEGFLGMRDKCNCRNEGVRLIIIVVVVVVVLIVVFIIIIVRNSSTVLITTIKIFDLFV